MPAAKQQPAATKFEGFPKQTQKFFAELAKNNNREWFEAHRDDYMNHVIAPAVAFVHTAGPKLQKLSPGVNANPDYNGKGSIKRIFTDQRFQKDRDPYKPYLDLMFWEGPIASKKDNSAFYLRLEPTQLHVVAGIKGFTREVLKAYRDAVSHPKDGPALDKVLSDLSKLSFIEVKGRNLKAFPRGYDPEASYRELLLHDGLYAVASEPIPAELHSDKLVEFCMERWKPMAPLHRWLVEKVLSRV